MYETDLTNEWGLFGNKDGSEDESGRDEFNLIIANKLFINSGAFEAYGDGNFYLAVAYKIKFLNFILKPGICRSFWFNPDASRDAFYFLLSYDL